MALNHADISYISPHVQSWMGEYRVQISTLLSPADNLSKEQARSIIRRYTAAIEGNFLSWMGATIVFARHPLSRFTAEENMMVEIKDDHPSMLHRFAEFAGALPEGIDFRNVRNSVEAIRGLVSRGSGMQCVALTACLEGGSIVFAPYLGNLAMKLRSPDLEYARIHGESDAVHSSRFMAALTCEMDMGYDSLNARCDEVRAHVLTLLDEIFNMDLYV